MLTESLLFFPLSSVNGSAASPGDDKQLSCARSAGSIRPEDDSHQSVEVSLSSGRSLFIYLFILKKTKKKPVISFNTIAVSC